MGGHATLSACVKGASDASARRWGGLLRLLGVLFRSAGDFSEEEIKVHIQDKEALALLRILQNALEVFSSDLIGRTILVDVDSQSLYNIFRNGGSNGESFITSICKKLFCSKLKVNSHSPYGGFPRRRMSQMH